MKIECISRSITLLLLNLDSAARTLCPKAVPYQPLLFLALTMTLCWHCYTHSWQIRRFHGRWPGASLGLFCDTVSHLPDCCSFIRIGVGCGRTLSTAPSQRKPLSVSDTSPGQASHLATNDPERELPLAWPASRARDMSSRL